METSTTLMSGTRVKRKPNDIFGLRVVPSTWKKMRHNIPPIASMIFEMTLYSAMSWFRWDGGYKGHRNEDRIRLFWNHSYPKVVTTQTTALSSVETRELSFASQELSSTWPRNSGCLLNYTREKCVVHTNLEHILRMWSRYEKRALCYELLSGWKDRIRLFGTQRFTLIQK